MQRSVQSCIIDASVLAMCATFCCLLATPYELFLLFFPFLYPTLPRATTNTIQLPSPTSFQTCTAPHRLRLPQFCWSVQPCIIDGSVLGVMSVAQLSSLPYLFLLFLYSSCTLHFTSYNEHSHTINKLFQPKLPTKNSF
ncbi:hypothetical protein EDC01DRAFT_480263 [Geopyxis carbonaria]|nr:hypothetical protein EDC01DRAFT_480263 [Geopyxis carbonaria]